jgi:hypothetical protein
MAASVTRLLVIVVATVLGSASAAAGGNVSIDSTPPGASVYVGDKADGEKGQTPVTLSLPPGDYTIVLELRGYGSEFVNIKVPRNKKLVTAKVTMHKAVGTLKVTVTGKASDLEIFVNDENKGAAPQTLELPADSYHVEIKRGSVVLRDEFVNVDDGQDVELTVDGASAGSKTSSGDGGKSKSGTGSGNGNGSDQTGDGEDTTGAGSGSGSKDPDDDNRATRLPWIELDATTTVMFRKVTYTSATTSNLFGYDQGGQVLLGVALQLYPLAKVDNFLRTLSLRGHGNFGVPQPFNTANVQMFPVKTSYRQLGAEVHYQLPIGSIALDAFSGYEKQRFAFSGDVEGLKVLPDADLTSVRLGGGVTARFGSVSAFASGEARVVLGGGPYMARFSNAKAQSFAFGGGGRGDFGRFHASLNATVANYAWGFLPTPEYQAKTATDRIITVDIGVGISY